MLQKMMNFGRLLLKYAPFAAVLFLILAIPASAQNEGGGLPDALARVITELGATLTALVVSGMAEVSRLLTEWVLGWNWLSEGDKSKISGLGANIVSAVSALVVTLIAIGVGQLTGIVGDLNINDLLVLLGGFGGATWGGSSAILHKLNKAATK